MHNGKEQKHLYSEDYIRSLINKDEDGVDVGIVGNNWGKAAAGMLVTCYETRELLLLERSLGVMQPGTWGIPGGARKMTPSGLQDSLVAAVNEAVEEMGDIPSGRVITDPFVYTKDDGFRFDTYVMLISKDTRDSFKPALNWESSDYMWTTMNNMPVAKLHPGFAEFIVHKNVTFRDTPVTEYKTDLEFHFE